MPLVDRFYPFSPGGGEDVEGAGGRRHWLKRWIT
jgi:hypothetical protein